MTLFSIKPNSNKSRNISNRFWEPFQAVKVEIQTLCFSLYMQIQCWIKDRNNKEIQEKLLWCAKETELDHRTAWLGPPVKKGMVLIFRTLPVFMTLILPSVCHSCMCDDQKRSCLLTSIWYHDYATSLSFICNDCSIEIQK